MKTANSLRPTDDELITAFEQAKADGYSSSDIKETDEGAGVLRAHLPSKYHVTPLDVIRRWAQNLSRAGKEPGTRKRTAKENAIAAIARLIRAFPPSLDHSAEYDAIHNGDKFMEIVSGLKADFDYRCQGCGRHRNDLEGHIIDYKRWMEPGCLLILCKQLCHPVADALLRYAKTLTADEIPDLFTELDQ